MGQRLPMCILLSSRSKAMWVKVLYRVPRAPLGAEGLQRLACGSRPSELIIWGKLTPRGLESVNSTIACPAQYLFCLLIFCPRGKKQPAQGHTVRAVASLASSFPSSVSRFQFQRPFRCVTRPPPSRPEPLSLSPGTESLGAQRRHWGSMQEPGGAVPLLPTWSETSPSISRL